MTMDIFRKEVVDYKRRRLWGEVFLDTPAGNWVLVSLLTALVCGAVAFFAFGSFSRSETVQGYVMPMGGMVQLYPSANGTVEAVLVAEGDHVAKGQPIGRIFFDRQGVAGPLNSRLGGEAQKRIGETNNQVTILRAHYLKDQQLLESKIEGIRDDISDLTGSLALEKEKLQLLQQDLARWQRLLDGGNASQSDLSQRKQSVLSELGAVQMIERQREAKKAELHDSAIERDTLANELEGKLSALNLSKSEIAADLIELDVGAAQVISSPVDGTVVALQAAPGEAVQPTLPVAAIVRDGDVLEAQLLVPTQSAGFIETGQEVRMRLDAFPYQRFGILTGRVIKISRAVYRPGELLAPVIFTAPVYRATVSLDRSSVTAYGVQRSLQPGMTMTADIVVDHRRFADWIFEPMRAGSGGKPS